jgi:hypothetical protein
MVMPAAEAAGHRVRRAMANAPPASAAGLSRSDIIVVPFVKAGLHGRVAASENRPSPGRSGRGLQVEPAARLKSLATVLRA